MSVIVRGMEMPDRCFVCPMYRNGNKVVNTCCYCAVSSVEVDQFKTWRPSDCPLLPLPEKHGRLIDADEKIKVQIYDDQYEDYKMVEMTIDDLLSQGWVEAEATTVVPAEGEEVCTKI